MAKGRPKLPPSARATRPVKLSPVGKLLDEVQRRWASNQKKLAVHEKKQREKVR
jgi:hypothetical protein